MQFRLVYPGSAPNDTYGSENATYAQVDAMRRLWAEGGPVDEITVQVDEGLGFGWEPYEFVNFAEEAA